MLLSPFNKITGLRAKQVLKFFENVNFSFTYFIYYPGKHNWSKVRKSIKNRTEDEHFGIWLCVVFDCYYKGFISGKGNWQ